VVFQAIWYWTATPEQADAYLKLCSYAELDAHTLEPEDGGPRGMTRPENFFLSYLQALSSPERRLPALYRATP